MRVPMVAGMLAVVLAAGAADGPGPEERLAEIRLWLDQGNYEEAIPAALGLVKSARDEKLKAEATRLLGDGLRKKGDWKLAAKAYETAAEGYEADSEAGIRTAAAAEVLKASPEGTYAPVEAKRARSADAEADDAAEPRTLSDDAYLAECLAEVGESRAARLKGKVRGLARLDTPPEVASRFEEIAAEFRRARVLAPEMDPEAERQAALTAGKRLEALAMTLLPKLRVTLDAMEQVIADRGTVSSAQREKLNEYHAMCVKMAEAEKTFRRVLAGILIPSWREGQALKRASGGHQIKYTSLASGFRKLARQDNRGGRGRGRRRRRR